MMALVPHYELQNLDNEQEIIEKIEEVFFDYLINSKFMVIEII